jgi:hypothetical protein
MPETTPNGAPYPLPEDPNDIPGAIQALAEWSDENLAAGAALNDATVTALAIDPTSQFAQEQQQSYVSFGADFAGFLATVPSGALYSYTELTSTGDLLDIYTGKKA